MAIESSFEQQVAAVMPKIFSEKIDVLDNYNYEGISPMFESISNYNEFFNIIFARPSCFLKKYAAQFYCFLASVKLDPAMATFRLLAEGEHIQTIKLLPLVLQFL